MISFSNSQRFYLFSKPADMRKSFDGLGGIVNNLMGGNLFSGDVFLFINRRRDCMKLLVWESNGFWIFFKRLEEGTFEFPLSKEGSNEVQIKWEELIMILEGIKLNSVKRRKRYIQSA